MTHELPESSELDPPYKIEGSMKDARQSFYELAKERIKYVTDEEAREWVKNGLGIENRSTTGMYTIGDETVMEGGIDVEKWIKKLKIIVNKDIFIQNGIDYSDLIPITIEHEIYESWLTAKKGAVTDSDVSKKHLLARRREFLLAEQEGLGERLFEFLMILNSGVEGELREALKYAKKRLKK